MINKKEFNLLLQEIFQIENKIQEVKIINQFDKANEYEVALELIRLKARDIKLDDEDKSNGFDELSLKVLSKLILLDSDIDYYLLKASNIIEVNIEDIIDPKEIEKIKKSWVCLEKDIEIWKKSNHNPIEEIEYNKHLGKITLNNIVYQLQVEGILDFSKVWKYCKREYLANAVKETLFEGAKEEFHDGIRRRRLINLAKNLSEKDIYDYKLWKQVLMIKKVRARDDHIEMIGSIQNKDDRKYDIEEKKNLNKIKTDTDEQDLELYYEDSILKSIKKWFSSINESANQRKMEFTWASDKGPAFKIEFQDGYEKYAKENLYKETIENAQKLIIATDGISKYNIEKDSNWKKLEEIEILENPNSSGVSLSPDKTYNFIGKESFLDCKNLKRISFGKIQMIGEKAFKNCTSLTEITFSKNIINVGKDAFLDCKNLRKATFLGDLELYILDRPQNILNCFKGTNLEEIIFANIDSAFNFAITDCPHLKKILVSNISNISIPFKVCKYRFGRQEGIVSFVGEKSLNLWKKRNSNIRFFELTEDDKKKYNIN